MWDIWCGDKWFERWIKLVYEEEVGVDGKLESIFALKWRRISRVGRRNREEKRRGGGSLTRCRENLYRFCIIWLKRTKKKRDNTIRAIFDAQEAAAASIRIYKDHWYEASCQMRIRVDPCARICHSHDIKWFTRSLPWVLYGPALNFPFELIFSRKYLTNQTHRSYLSIRYPRTFTNINFLRSNFENSHFIYFSLFEIQIAHTQRLLWDFLPGKTLNRNRSNRASKKKEERRRRRVEIAVDISILNHDDDDIQGDVLSGSQEGKGRGGKGSRNQLSEPGEFAQCLVSPVGNKSEPNELWEQKRRTLLTRASSILPPGWNSPLFESMVSFVRGRGEGRGRDTRAKK